MVKSMGKNPRDTIFMAPLEVRSKIQRLFLEQLRKQGEDDLDEARFLEMSLVEFLRQVFFLK
jgi:hypothetical protein